MHERRAVVIVGMASLLLAVHPSPSLIEDAAPQQSAAVHCHDTLVADPKPGPLAETLDGLIGSSQGLDIELSVAVSTSSAEPIYWHNAQLPLLPASNQKLVTAMGAIALLPSDFVFSTRVLAGGLTSGARTPGEEASDLFLRAGGDPTLTAQELDELAAQVRTSGITQVAGDLVVEVDRFNSSRAAPGWPDWLQPTYAGPMSALIVDDNRWRADERFLIDPDTANGERFARALERAGVRLIGTTRVGEVDAEAFTAASVDSSSRDELIRTMLRRSDNEVADALVREIGFVKADVGSTTVGLDVIREYLATSLCVSLQGVDGDGSGLSRQNERSAQEWVALLAAAQQEPWFEDFRDSLPVAGQSGTLASRLSNPATRGRVQAKTGTIIGGRALSGYLERDSGEELIFSIVVNGEGSDRALGLIDAIVVAIAEG